ncbi:MAG: peptide deformylase [Devosiaceae bacterium]|nr:peptide deformylase [Devosiaceae bacterium MH13]
MAIREILVLPDKRLYEVSKPVAEITAEIRTLVDDMYETMYDAPGIGLAAIQVGVPMRVVVTDCSPRDDEAEPLTLINPEILELTGDPVPYEEGCLSIPDYYDEVSRPPNARVRYMDLDGETHEIDVDGLLSTCIQHEVDHLDGKLFIDYLSAFKRSRVVSKFKKQARLRDKLAS